MKMAMMGGNQGVDVIEVADPKVADNYARVKVMSAPLCTEYKWMGKDRRSGFGHEAAGEVVEVGPKVRSVGLGDRVAVMPANGCGVCDICRSGYYIHCQSPRKPLEICGCEHGRDTVAQYLVQQDWLLLKIPHDIADDHGAMACCGFGPGFHAMQSMNVSAGDTVLINGLGPVGLGAMTIALYRGAKVFGVDVNAYRSDLAMQLGAAGVFDPRDEDAAAQIIEATSGNGVGHSLDTSGVETAGKFLVKIARRRGQIAFVAHGPTLDVGPIFAKGLTIHGCWHWNHLNHAKRMFATIRGSTDRISRIITHTYSLTDINQAIATQQTGQCGKVIIHP